MLKQYDIIAQLTSKPLSYSNRTRMLNDFAYEFGWLPSDTLDAPGVDDFSNAHLVVEHGLENTAVLTFLKSTRRFSDLDHAERKRLISISYNNLVDWHIQIEIDKVSFVFNRAHPLRPFEYAISRDNLDKLRGEVFEQVIGKRPSANVPALDSALIRTISDWKRRLSAEMGYDIPNTAFSALFNGIIFVRAVEDHFRRLQHVMHQSESTPTLLETWSAPQSSHLTLCETIRQRLKDLTEDNIPEFLFDEDELCKFDRLERRTVSALLSDFYRNRFAPYDYDFSLMSKHALSRIYEHYVSILRLEDSPQLTLFPRLPEEERDKAYGSIYTPQFIARFFAKYLREQMPPLAYKNIRTADPACGSGIFLRTLLELQCDPTQNGISTQLIKGAFGNVFGLDIDENACQATRLSLALLHLILTDSLPQDLNVVSAEAIEYCQNTPDLKNRYDAVIANPPHVSLTTQRPEMRERVTQFMNGYATGKIDMYLAFLRIGLEMLKPGGYGLFVLPHSFLLSKSAAKMRKVISEKCWIRCLADLSAIRIFEDSGSYIILLIFQKLPEIGHKAPPATIIKCHDLVGLALQDALEGRSVETNIYSIYEVEQETFREDEWLVLPPTEFTIKRKFKDLPRIHDFFHVRVGFISGADDIFIVSDEKAPEGEEELFVPFLHDREMDVYTVPERTTRRFFYPYIHGRKIKEHELREKYPKTWEYLSSNEEDLRNRPPVRRGQVHWWEPERPRLPEHIMRPKIVTPHLVLVPRFSLDVEGKYAVSHAPLLYPKEAGAEVDFLRFFLAILNSTSCYWHIATHSHKYRGGYVMLEPKTLKNTPVPDPAQVPSKSMHRIVKLVDRRLLVSGVDALEIEKQLDELVADLYGLSSKERRILGLEE